MCPEKFVALLEMRKGSIKPNHKYKRRVRLADGTYKYVYSERELGPLTKVTKKDDWVAAAAGLLRANVIKNININKRAATTLAVDARNIVVVGPDNLLGRKYVENTSKSAYKGRILGYKTEGGNKIPDAYVYPVESVSDKLALEAQKFLDLPQRLKLVHAWADDAIKKRGEADRQVALVIRLLRGSQERVGGSGGSSVSKEVVSHLQKQKRERGWSVAQYRDELEKHREPTYGILDLESRHVRVSDSGNNQTVVTLQFLAKAARTHTSAVVFDRNNSADVAYLAELERRLAKNKLFDIPLKKVSDKYAELGNTTPHTERHSFARQQFVDKILDGWKVTRRYKNKTAAKKALKEAFYQNISVPLGHENKSHTITTALNSYVGLDMKMAYEGLLAEIDRRYQKAVIEAHTTDRNFVPALARLLTLAAVKRDLPEDAESVVFV